MYMYNVWEPGAYEYIKPETSFVTPRVCFWLILFSELITHLREMEREMENIAIHSKFLQSVQDV